MEILPAASTAVMVKVCAPSDKPVRLGDVTAFPSKVYVKVAVLSVLETEKSAVFRLLSCLGVAPNNMSGGVKSVVQV